MSKYSRKHATFTPPPNRHNAGKKEWEGLTLTCKVIADSSSITFNLTYYSSAYNHRSSPYDIITTTVNSSSTGTVTDPCNDSHLTTISKGSTSRRANCPTSSVACACVCTSNTTTGFTTTPGTCKGTTSSSTSPAPLTPPPLPPLAPTPLSAVPSPAPAAHKHKKRPHKHKKHHHAPAPAPKPPSPPSPPVVTSSDDDIAPAPSPNTNGQDSQYLRGRMTTKWARTGLAVVLLLAAAV
ncbi:unnamed protein product [Linum tenue]|uniref:Uncharacterized protein n=1 Tax=Linum tenue TaxID=586396 RepID=A0AAV0R631_9ROSI|nr:unnamed protein product [Linum tenue]